MSGVFVQATQGAHVWLDTPRGALGGCWKCGEKSMRACECYQDRERNEFISKFLDGFHGSSVPSPDKEERVVGKHGHHHHVKKEPSGDAAGKFPRAPSHSRTSSRASMAPPDRSLEESLVELKDWKDRGLIDEAEYKSQKAKVLDIAAEMSRPASSMSLTIGPNVPMTTNQRYYQDPSAVRQRRVAYSNAAAADKAARGEQDMTPSSKSSRFDEEEEPGHPGVSKPHLDFLFKQLRQICYRKVRGNGNDVSIREIFRHFDSEKHGDAPGVDRDEFVLAVKRLMLGTAERGIISTDEAIALFDRIDADKSGTIDYRETASTLSMPGWDNKVLGKKSNVLL